MPGVKPKLFIGSSSAGFAVAKKLKTHLTAAADVYLWKEGAVWEVNRSTFDNLLRLAHYFDYGVFVATADDLTLTKDQLVLQPRDNVILEMALFLGAMGRDKSFLLVEEDIKLPSDFEGIFMPRFQRDKAGSLKKAAEQLLVKISETNTLAHLSLYPTTALAIGYFKNFLSDLVDGVRQAVPMEIDGVRFTDFRIKVVMPASLKGMIRQKAALFYQRHGLVENAIKTPFRAYPSWFRLDPASAPLALIYDMPSTLTGIDDAIEMLLQKGFRGRTEMQAIIEERELNNFRKVLQLMIDESPFAQAFVEIVSEY